MSIYQFARLPEELLQEILLHSNYDNIQKLCSISNDFKSICILDKFWRAKIIHDYGFNPPTTGLVGLTSILEEIYLYQNNILSFGKNDYGQLGLGNNTDRSIPTQINYMKAKYVSCGNSHTVLIDMNNNVWSFGFNKHGQLGLGDNVSRNAKTLQVHLEEPTKINGIKAKSVSCGEFHTILIDMNNNVWAFGYNTFGQLGLGDNTNRNVPTKINGIKAKYVSCGENHTLLIDLNNNVWVFGSNDNGQLGLGDNINKYVPTKINGIKAKYVSCGENHTVIIDMDNNILAFGYNEFGQLGLGDNVDKNEPEKINGIKAKYVSCGYEYTLLIDMNNNVWSFGDNYEGQLGLGNNGDNTNRNVPTKINNIKAKYVSCGYFYTMLIDMDNNVWSFGRNYCGKLGLGDNIDRNEPIKINDIKAKSVSCGVNHTVLITGISN